MRGKAHSDEVRAEAIAALLAGLGVSEVARKYNLPKQTVSRLRADLGDQLGQVGTENRARLDDLLLDALASNLAAQAAITEAVSDENYIRGQDASAIAELYETLADKAIRLLEAAQAGEQSEDADNSPSMGAS